MAVSPNASHPRLDLEIRNAASQQLAITLVADETHLFEENVRGEPADPDAVMPDPVEVFARCANRGMFGASGNAHETSVLVDRKTFEPEHDRQTWALTTTHLNPDAFTILIHLLQARLPRALIIRTIGTSIPPETPLRAPDNRDYPRLPKNPGFEGEIEAPDHSGRDRGVEIVFAAHPEPDFVETLFEDLRHWTHLFLLGGFPRVGTHPRQAGGFPDHPIQPDAWSVGIECPIFASHDAALWALVHYAHRLHRQGHEVARVLVY